MSYRSQFSINRSNDDVLGRLKDIYAVPPSLEEKVLQRQKCKKFSISRNDKYQGFLVIMQIMSKAKETEDYRLNGVQLLSVLLLPDFKRVGQVKC